MQANIPVIGYARLGLSAIGSANVLNRMNDEVFTVIEAETGCSAWKRRVKRTILLVLDTRNNGLQPHLVQSNKSKDSPNLIG